MQITLCAILNKALSKKVHYEKLKLKAWNWFLPTLIVSAWSNEHHMFEPFMLLSQFENFKWQYGENLYIQQKSHVLYIPLT